MISENGNEKQKHKNTPSNRTTITISDLSGRFIKIWSRYLELLNAIQVGKARGAEELFIHAH